MAFKSNFTGLHRDGDTMVLSGRSDPDPPGDVVDIRVVLAQGERIERASVDVINDKWNVRLPSDGFAAGPAVAFGIETRRENAATLTWTQTIEIP
jgi:hypothetical protein